MKKLLFYSMLFELLTFNLNAQMMDLMGSMAIGGTINAGSVNTVGTMNKQLKKTQLISDIQMKVVDIMTTYGGQYKKLKTSEINSGGVNIVFSSVEDGRAFQAAINNPTQQTCQTILTTHWDGAIYLNVVSGTNTKKLNLSEASSSSDILCKNIKLLAIIYQ